MKVRELMEVLSGVDSDLVVLVVCPDGQLRSGWEADVSRVRRENVSGCSYLAIEIDEDADDLADDDS